MGYGFAYYTGPISHLTQVKLLFAAKTKITTVSLKLQYDHMEDFPTLWGMQSPVIVLNCQKKAPKTKKNIVDACEMILLNQILMLFSLFETYKQMVSFKMREDPKSYIFKEEIVMTNWPIVS